MNKKESVQQLIIEQGILPLYYHESSDISITILKALYQAGIRAVEYTNRGANALHNFTLLLQIAKNEMPGMQLGIGTIKTIAAAEAFIDAGADFIICPIIDPAVGEVIQKAGLLWIPGCMTPTEILQAEKAGIRLVKLFPGNVLGPSFVHAIKGLFTAMQFMPTGGVDTSRENLHAWFSAGVCAVGMGSKLISPKTLQEENYSSITETVKEVLHHIQHIKLLV